MPDTRSPGLGPRPLNRTLGFVVRGGLIVGIIAAVVVALLAAALAFNGSIRSDTEVSAAATEREGAIIDDMGRAVEAPERPARIVVLAPFAADMLLDMGVRPAAVPAIRGAPPDSWRGIATVAVDHSAGPNIEQIVAAKPDLIIANSVHAQFVPTLEASAGAPILVLDINRLDDVARHLRTLGSITGRSARAEELAAGVELAAASQASASRPGPPTRVLAIFGTPHAFFGFLPETYMGDLIKRASGQLVTEGLESHRVFRGLTPLSMEAIVSKEPEVVLVVFHGAPDAAEALLARDPAWSRLAAVRNGRVHVLTEDHFIMHPGRSPDKAIAMIADALRKDGR